MSEVVQFPQKKCCMCDKQATKSIKLFSPDTAVKAGRKYFCASHVPYDEKE